MSHICGSTPLSLAVSIKVNAMAIIKEIQHWLGQLGDSTLAVYWRRFSNRTFFIVNPTKEIRDRAQHFVHMWGKHCELITPIGSAPKWSGKRSTTSLSSRLAKLCPECSHRFKGLGWGGIDAHWKAQHKDIMSYDQAWPLIKQGLKPSSFK